MLTPVLLSVVVICLISHVDSYENYKPQQQDWSRPTFGNHLPSTEPYLDPVIENRLGTPQKKQVKGRPIFHEFFQSLRTNFDLVLDIISSTPYEQGRGRPTFKKLQDGYSPEKKQISYFLHLDNPPNNMFEDPHNFRQPSYLLEQEILYKHKLTFNSHAQSATTDSDQIFKRSSKELLDLNIMKNDIKQLDESKVAVLCLAIKSMWGENKPSAFYDLCKTTIKNHLHNLHKEAELAKKKLDFSLYETSKVKHQGFLEVSGGVDGGLRGGINSEIVSGLGGKVGGGVACEVDGKVGGEVGGEIDGEIGGGVDREVGGGTGIEIGGKMGAGLDKRVGKEKHGQISVGIVSEITGGIDGGIGSGAGKRVDGKIDGGIREKIGDEIVSKIASGIGKEIGGVVDGKISGKIGSKVGSKMSGGIGGGINSGIVGGIYSELDFEHLTRVYNSAEQEVTANQFATNQQSHALKDLSGQNLNFVHHGSTQQSGDTNINIPLTGSQESVSSTGQSSYSSGQLTDSSLYADNLIESQKSAIFYRQDVYSNHHVDRNINVKLKRSPTSFGSTSQSFAYKQYQSNQSLNSNIKVIVDGSQGSSGYSTLSTHFGNNQYQEESQYTNYTAFSGEAENVNLNANLSGQEGHANTHSRHIYVHHLTDSSEELSEKHKSKKRSKEKGVDLAGSSRGGLSGGLKGGLGDGFNFKLRSGSINDTAGNVPSIILQQRSANSYWK